MSDQNAQCTVASLEEVIRVRFGGRLSLGRHDAYQGCACILEAVSVCEGVPWTDDPRTLDRPDVRRINDARWSSDEQRTAGMLRLAPLLAAWPGWAVEKRISFAQRVTMRTITDLLPSALRVVGLGDHAIACERATENTVYSAARAAARAAAANYENDGPVYAVFAAADYAESAQICVSSAKSAAASRAPEPVRTCVARDHAAGAIANAAGAALYVARVIGGDTDGTLNLAVSIWAEEAE